VRGQPVRVVSLYAEAPDYHLVGSPARDGFEGIASVDDAARAAVGAARAADTPASARRYLYLPAFPMLLLSCEWTPWLSVVRLLLAAAGTVLRYESPGPDETGTSPSVKLLWPGSGRSSRPILVAPRSSNP